MGRKKKQELKAKKLEKEQSSSSKRKRRSTSKRSVGEEDDSESDEGVSAPKTRNVNIDFSMEDSDIASDPEIDYVNQNGEQEEVPTEKEAAKYFFDRIKSGAFAKKYH